VGGSDASASGIKPSQHTLSSRSNFVLAAAPVRGGNSNLYGCLVKLNYKGREKYSSAGKDDVNQLNEQLGRAKRKIDETLVYFGDHYKDSANSNYKMKVDLSMTCEPIVRNFAEPVDYTVVSCPGTDETRVAEAADRFYSQMAQKEGEAVPSQGVLPDAPAQPPDSLDRVLFTPQRMHSTPIQQNYYRKDGNATI
jgi:hypothetical protein